MIESLGYRLWPFEIVSERLTLDQIDCLKNSLGSYPAWTTQYGIINKNSVWYSCEDLRTYRFQTEEAMLLFKLFVT